MQLKTLCAASRDWDWDWDWLWVKHSRQRITSFLTKSVHTHACEAGRHWNEVLKQIYGIALNEHALTRIRAKIESRGNRKLNERSQRAFEQGIPYCEKLICVEADAESLVVVESNLSFPPICSNINCSTRKKKQNKKYMEQNERHIFACIIHRWSLYWMWRNVVLKVQHQTVSMDEWIIKSIWFVFG